MRILWTAAAMAGLSAPAAAAQPYDLECRNSDQSRELRPHRKLCGDGHGGQSFGPSECIGYPWARQGMSASRLALPMRADNLKAAGGPGNGTLPVAECRAAVAGRLRKSDATLP